MGRQRSEKSDRISNLPEDITESILARLSIRDLVRTSILSRYWRYKWTSVPVLDFDDDAVGRYSIKSNTENIYHILFDDKLIKIIYRILCQHKGPIHKFTISVDAMITSQDINQWINYLSRNGIKELILKFFCVDRFKVHSSLFSCVNLRELNLFGYCMIPSPPSTFNGFNDLTCLELTNVKFNDEGFEKLIAKCPQLETLRLLYVDGLYRLHIDQAPKLQTLCFNGRLKYICLNNTSSLSYARISFNQFYPPDLNVEYLGYGGSIRSINNLNGLSNLREFVAGSYFLKFIDEGSVRKSLPSTFNHLLRIHFVDLMFEDISSLSSVLRLITCSPNLEKLEIETNCTTRYSSAAADQMKRATEYLEGESHSINTCLMKLRYVEMKELLGAGPEMELIKLILGNSPSLVEMQIVLRHDETDAGFKDRELQMLKKLIPFRRASKIAKVIYDGQVL